MPEYEYTIEEWSQDTRKWTLRTDKKLKNNTTFTFDGTSYGDDCQVEYFGDFESE